MLMPAVQGGHQILSSDVILSSDTTNYNLNSDLQNNYGWDGSSAIEVVLTINSGVNVFSTSTNTAAITASLVAGSTLTINNSGNIIARGGAGGAGGSNGGAGSAGGAGGYAINLANVTATINNLSGAVIAGGGGGGGGQGSARGRTSKDAEGNCQGDTRTNNGSAGGAGASTDDPPTNTAGTRGGSWGQAGSSGPAASTAGSASGCVTSQGGGGSGGAAGKAIHVGSGASRTLNNSGTTHGATS